MSELERLLDEISNFYDPSSIEEDFDSAFKIHHAEKIQKNLSGEKILELGCSTGLSTHLLDNGTNHLEVVEGSVQNIEAAKKNFEFKNVTFIHSLWENFHFNKTYSDILLVDTIQMVQDRENLFKKIKNCMTEDSKFHIIAPNNNSFHRLLGIEMNLIENIDDQSERDQKVSATQDLGWVSCRELLDKNDFRIVYEEGILFKLFDNDKMSKLEPQIVDALFKLGNKFKDTSAHMYFCCKLK